MSRLEERGGRRARLRQLAGSLWSDRFLRRLALLSGGTMLGQGILLSATPLLTRLYSPEAFGLLAVFSAIAGILGSVVCLRYELAIPVCVDDDEAAGMAIVATLAAVAVTGSLALSLYWLGPSLATLTATPELSALYWLLPPVLLLWGLSLALDYWWIRHGAFRLTATQKVVRLAAQAAAQLGLGAGGSGSRGLVIGLALGHLIGIAYYLLTLPAAARFRLSTAWLRSLRSLWALAHRHWHYPAYSTPAALLQSATQFLPAVLLAALYGPAAAGWFGLAQWTLELPARLLSNSASAVYLGEARGLEPLALHRLFLRTAGHFAVIGLLGMTPLLLFGPALFALVFGEPWRPAGEFVQYLIPVQLARFVVIPISQTLNVLQRQDLHLLSACFNIAALGLAFGLGHWLELPALTTLLLLSLGSAAAYLAYLGLTWRTVLRSLARPPGGVLPPEA